MSEAFSIDYEYKATLEAHNQALPYDEQVSLYVNGDHEEPPEITSGVELRMTKKVLSRMVAENAAESHLHGRVADISKDEELASRFNRVNENIANYSSPAERSITPDLVFTGISNEQAKDMKWKERAACKDMETEYFFPEDAPKRHREDLEAFALATCARCEVVKQCDEYAVKNKMKDGIWGGVCR